MIVCGGDTPYLPPAGIYASADGGATFRRLAGTHPPGMEALAFDQATPGLLVCGTASRVTYLSRDGGRTFRPLPGSEKIPTGKCGRVALDRGRVYVFTAGSGIWTATLDADVL